MQRRFPKFHSSFVSVFQSSVATMVSYATGHRFERDFLSILKEEYNDTYYKWY